MRGASKALAILDSSPGSWQCEGCTFINENTLEMSYRKDRKIKSVPPSEWSSVLEVCDVCGEVRSRGALSSSTVPLARALTSLESLVAAVGLSGGRGGWTRSSLTGAFSKIADRGGAVTLSSFRKVAQPYLLNETIFTDATNYINYVMKKRKRGSGTAPLTAVDYADYYVSKRPPSVFHCEYMIYMPPLLKARIKDIFDFHERWSEFHDNVHNEDMRVLSDLSLRNIHVSHKIGEGCNGQLFQFSPTDNGRLVFSDTIKSRTYAMKKLYDLGPGMETKDAPLVKEFLKDFETPRKFPHPYINKIFSYCRDVTYDPTEHEREFGVGKTWYVFMEKCVKNFEELVKEVREKEGRRLSEEEVIVYLLQILAVLCHLSEHGVAHRDLKLNNIMWKRAEELRLIDFGTATEDLRATDKSGNIAHFAPEVFNSSDDTVNWEKNDIWSVGILVYELLGMENPFMDRSYDPTRRPAPLVDGYDKLQHFVDHVLIYSPEHRLNVHDALELLQFQFWDIPLDDGSLRAQRVLELAETLHMDLVQSNLLSSNDDFLYFSSMKEKLLMDFLTSQIPKEQAIAAVRLYSET